eukprot:TRINITY_DN12186_c0_g1_i1.p1 TRINITY_DN12186_c0_g1~~TRINITY_DN12186_c0_g1_i1.p1  ORF type:complete len:969 (-),score=101.96 TRINITY_DN12186_c0_g1_i1:1787-4504(-)
MQAVQKVLDARPTDFLALPQEDRQTPQTKLALRPNRVNQRQNIWQPVQVETNYFKLRLNENVRNVYQYDLQVNRQIHGQPLESMEVYRKVFRRLQLEQNWPPSTIHDGRKTVWDFSDRLADGADGQGLIDHEVAIDGGARSVYVTFKFVRQLDNMQELQASQISNNMDNIGWIIPEECIRVLDSALRMGALYDAQRYALRGRQIFDLTQDEVIMDANSAYEVLMGYRESVRVVAEGLVLNLNTIYNMSHRGGRMTEFFQQNGVSDPNRTIEQHENVFRRLSTALRGLKVLMRVQDEAGEPDYKNFRVQGLCQQGSDYQFTNRQGQNVTVGQHFMDTYQYQIKYPQLNLLKCTTGGGGEAMVPVELCRIVRGEFEKAEARLQAELIRKAAKMPSLRWNDISKAVQEITNRLQEDPARFWLHLESTQWLQGEGFIIPQPLVQYGEDSYIDTQKGQWQGWKYGQSRNMQFHQYFSTNRIDSWAVLNYGLDPQLVQDFCTQMTQFANEHVMKNQIRPFNPNIVVNCGQPPRDIDNRSQIRTEVMRVVKEAKDRAKGEYRQNPQIIFVLFPRPHLLYNYIKGVLEGNNEATFQAIKIPSQVVSFAAFDKGRHNFGYLKQLMLKVNCKVGGSNFRIAGGHYSIPLGDKAFAQLRQEGRSGEFYPFMFMGADVTHPTGNESGTSVAAVVGSLDASSVRYAARISIQAGRQENINKMYDCTDSLLQQFQNQNNILPNSIIMYRDGVSEGQFVQVLQSEYQQIKRAANYLREGYDPKLTFVIVQKRHHVRPRPKGESSEADDGKKNLVPGVVIDRSGCHPFEFQFFLNSHITIQGTNRPTLYTVLVDEIGLGAEQTQLITYWLTYTYQRCARSVSIPPPAYYAHHACTRGRILEGQNCTGGLVVPELEETMYWM